MIVELGHFAVILALAVAVIQSTVPLIGAQRRNAAWMAVGDPAAVVQFLLVGFSFAALTYAFVVSDFSLVAGGQQFAHAEALALQDLGRLGEP
jgi:cytochrome c-type biogenesis protein CcmF